MKIALLGYGKMGKTIEKCLLENQEHQVVLKINSGNRNSITKDELKTADVAIEFSQPTAAIDNIRYCFEAGVPIVTGTTGWYGQIESVKQWCSEHNGALVYASNFSIGVNLFFELNKRLGLLMKPRKEYEPFLTEIHHTQKKDAPSGTAITLANDLLINSTTKSSWVNITDTPPHSKAANPDELIILSRRQDDVVGNHSVEYRSADDRIEIRHEAFSRDGFAKGALAAAGWIRNRKGCYTFSDIMESI